MMRWMFKNVDCLICTDQGSFCLVSCKLVMSCTDVFQPGSAPSSHKGLAASRAYGQTLEDQYVMFLVYRDVKTEKQFIVYLRVEFIDLYTRLFVCVKS